eukprot:CAMPEP_0198276156 /NCGR_PEP_ID=MMETSP1447-20131203/65158_1 /TAXON_ID=420782 /ORGANISM="Chaetoceros dichaeta, Strain CCMP1751" /LENGTH=417 /DNA_ID=CAMNT_0043971079 /DNA_START=102 /DNA_END=1355 /DNA_ORIENTATION=-
MSSSKNHNHHGRDINLKQENRCRSTSPSPTSSAFNLICRMETLSQKWKGFKVSIPSPCFTTCSSKNHHGCSINLKQENRDHSTSASSALKTTISITESRGDATSATASVSTSSQTEKGGYARPISPTTVSTTHSRKEKDILDSMLSPSDWQWQQCSMTSILSTIQTSTSARPTPIRSNSTKKKNNRRRWKISKRRKSSKVIKELSPKGPFLSPILMKEEPPTCLPGKQSQSQPQQPTLITIESTALDSMLSPSDWQWQQCSMTSILSTIQTSTSARPTPIRSNSTKKKNNRRRWKISKRRKSSKVIKELSPKGPFLSPILMKEEPPTCLPGKQSQSQPQQPTLIAIESTAPPIPQRNARNVLFLQRILWERRRVLMKKNLLHNGVENYVKVLRVATLGNNSEKSEDVNSERTRESED